MLEYVVRWMDQCYKDNYNIGTEVANIRIENDPW